jgi:hypothetical protein
MRGTIKKNSSQNISIRIPIQIRIRKKNFVDPKKITYRAYIGSTTLAKT